jgi:hypothetical protein
LPWPAPPVARRTRGRLRMPAALGRLLDRAGQVVELDQVARHVGRAGHHAADFLLQDAGDFLLPFPQEGLGRGHHHFAQAHLDRQHPETGGVGRGHHRGHRGEIDLQGSMRSNPAPPCRPAIRSVPRGPAPGGAAAWRPISGRRW